MALHDERADILGGPILQRPETGLLATFSQYHFVFKSVALLGLGLLVWIACARGLEHLKKHRELRYRKAMRRKHGIPDSDCRPFAVAYAAAKRAHLEREAQDRKKTTNYVSDHNSPAADQPTNAQKTPRGLRRRVPETTLQLHAYQHPETHTFLRDNKLPDVYSLNFADRYNPSSRHQVPIPETLPAKQRPVRQASRKDLIINHDDQEESRKRSFEDEGDAEHEAIKKSRLDGDEYTNGDEQADWYAQYSEMSPRRAFKQSLDQQSENKYVHVDDPERFKCFNDPCNEDHEPADEIMEGVDEDDAIELKAVARGRKRDRAEAGSSFGGDDEEDIQNGSASHCRKRRTILRKRTEVVSRGQKRDREAESLESESEGDGAETSRGHVYRGSKTKRGKKAASDEPSEASMKDSGISRDPLCSGRKVGDEWEVDGVQYKVGDKGERLRLTLVKKARHKYHMPQDSQHADRPTTLEIYVETWMTEEQYKQAGGKQELAWQEASKESNGSKTPDAPESPTKNGKNLLWDSVKGSPARQPFRQPIPSSSTRINPFEQWQLQPALGRRVASSSTIVSPILPGVTDSPTRPGFRGFSKWEKQDREAEAMVRIRAKVEEQKKAQGLLQKVPEILTSATVPTITLTPVPTPAAEGISANNASISKPSTPTFSLVASPSTSDRVEGVAAPTSTTAPVFSLPSTSVPTSAPSTFLSTPATSTTDSSSTSVSSFSFMKPSQVLPPTTTVTSSPKVPNFTGKEVAAGTLPSTTLSSSNPGVTTRPQPPSTESAPTSSPFFAKPHTPSCTSSPTAVAPMNKPQVSIFGSAPSSSSSVAFSSTPSEGSVSTISPSATTSDGSKSTASLFSFLGAPSSSSSTVPPITSTSSVPKFSFGQPFVTSASTPGFNLASGIASQSKPTFKFGQTPSGAMDGGSAPTSRVADESKKFAPVLGFGTTAGSNEPAKPSPFATISPFGSLTSGSASATNPFAKPVVVGGDASIHVPPKPAPASTNIVTLNNTFPSTPAAAPASSSAPTFSFDVTKSIEGPKPASLFGSVTGGTKPASMFGGAPAEGKPTFAFNSSAENPKLTSILGANVESSRSPSVFGPPAEGSKPTFAFGVPAEPSKATSVFDGTVEGSKTPFAFSGTTENKSVFGTTAESSKSTARFATTPDSSASSNTAGVSKLASTPGDIVSGSSHSVPTFTFGKKDDATTNTNTSMAKPVTSFTFGVSPGPMFGQPSTSATSGGSNQSTLGKPANTPAPAFGLIGTGGSGSPSTFTFGKPATQNQKQEQ